MRTLLDECVPKRLAQAFGADHEASRVTRLDWPARRTASYCASHRNGFDALITVDAGLYVAPGVPLRVLVLRAGSNRLQSLLPLMPGVLEQLAALPPGRTEIIAARPSA